MRVQYGTDGSGGDYEASRIYGIAREGMLNFGLYGAPLPFLALGALVRFSTRVYRRARTGSVVAAVLAPCLAVSCILAFGSDLDNVLWFMVKQVLPSAALLCLAVVRADRSASAAAAVLPARATSGGAA